MEDCNFYVNRGEFNQYSIDSSVEAPEIVFKSFLEHIENTELDKSIRKFVSFILELDKEVIVNVYFDCVIRDYNIGRSHKEYYLNIDIIGFGGNTINNDYSEAIEYNEDTGFYNEEYKERTGFDSEYETVDDLFDLFDIEELSKYKPIYNRILIMKKLKDNEEILY